MKRTTTILATILSTTVLANAQVIISDNYDVVGNGTGFGANSGVNTDIANRLTGTAAAGLQYINMAAKPDTSYSITGGKLQGEGNNGGAGFTLSGDGTTAFNFASALGSTIATPSNKATYEISLSMANNLAGGPRFSFGFLTDEPLDGVGTAPLWDIGVQLDRANGSTSGTVTKYDIFGRIDSASRSDATDANFLIDTTANGTYGTEINVVLRVTDAGAETTGLNSRVEVSLDGGSTFIYDSDNDGGFRFDGSGRYFVWDFAANNGTGDRGFGTYDNFSVNVITPVPEPSTTAMLALGGIGAFWFYRRRA